MRSNDTMMKIASLLLLATCVGIGPSTIARADGLPIHAGLRVGPAFVEYSTKPNTYYAGPSVGVLGEVGLDGTWALQSGLLYMFTEDRDKSSGVTISTKIGWFNLPLLARYTLAREPVRLSVAAGLNLAFRASAITTNEATKVSLDLSSLYNATDVGLTAGIGAAFGFGLTVDLLYTPGLSNISAIPILSVNTKTIKILLGYELF